MKRITTLITLLVLVGQSVLYAQIQPDSCVTPYEIYNNTVIPSGQSVIDEACFEIVLDEGFEADNYVGQIGNASGDENNLLMVSNDQSSAISLLARVKNNQIWLRWVPESETDWDEVSRKSYTVKRSELINGVWSDSSTIATLQGIKLADSSSWIGNSDSLYEYTYYLTTDDIETVSTADYDYETELFFKYFGAVNAYNINFNLAVQSGHGFIDQNVVAGHTYSYIIEATKDNNQVIDSGDPLPIKLEENGTMPTVPVSLRASESAITPHVYVSWIAKGLRKYYGTYDIMKSTDGVNYTKVNELPLVFNGSTYDNTQTPENANYTEAQRTGSVSFMTYTDSVENKTQRYYYKVVGNSYFSDMIEFEVSEILVKKTYLESPAIDSVYALTNGNMEVKWRFPDDVNNPVLDTLLKQTAWQLWGSNKDSIPNYAPIGNLKGRSLRTMQFTKQELASAIDTTKAWYFIVSGITNGGDTLRSLSNVYIPDDVTPPAKPTGFDYVITNDVKNNLRILSFTWTPNTEADLQGYTIKRRIGENDTLIVISAPEFKRSDLTSVDTVSLEAVLSVEDIDAKDSLALNLTYPTIYYSIAAVDFNNNESDTMQIEYSIPDIIRPMPPAIRHARSATDSVGDPIIRLSLTFSPESGTTHELWRTSIVADDFTSTGTNVELFTPSQRDTLYIDTDVEPNTNYYYVFLAKDAAGNESCFQEIRPSFDGSYTDSNCLQIVEVSVTSGLTKPSVITSFTGEVLSLDKAIRVEWIIDSAYEDEIKEFEIYKAEYATTDTLIRESLYKVAASYDVEFIDEEPGEEKVNKYMIRAILKREVDGEFIEIMSDWEEVELNY